ncbi:GNAT family N-acetyltransferase [Streptomyces carpinensis]|uniref:GNAT family N-acetyltransferase n=1 Tax=Streptomyces carpinensis TaxID=66369 RepID=A0ABV1WAU1_9ACTN|nr:GNAT family N-acetyltransferase [Streptomyces carpinensis]
MASDDWHLTDDVDEFLARAGDFLRSRPAPHTVHLTVTENLRARGGRIYGGQDPEFGVLEREGQSPREGEADGAPGVRAAFFRTPPHPIVLTALTEGEADALAGQLAGIGRKLSGVNAERDTAAAFAAAWRRRTGAETALRVRMRLYRLGELNVPRPVPPGRARVAGAEDRKLLVRWYEEFCAAVGESAGRDAREWADEHVERGDVMLWETPDATPVAMAGTAPKVAGQIRVLGVYTPAHLRGRGYAGAVTAEASRAALERGAAEVLLFTDLANPTSNGLYQRIGYRPVSDFAVYDFG